MPQWPRHLQAVRSRHGRAQRYPAVHTLPRPQLPRWGSRWLAGSAAAAWVEQPPCQGCLAARVLISQLKLAVAGRQAPQARRHAACTEFQQSAAAGWAEHAPLRRGRRGISVWFVCVLAREFGHHPSPSDYVSFKPPSACPAAADCGQDHRVCTNCQMQYVAVQGSCQPVCDGAMQCSACMHPQLCITCSACVQQSRSQPGACLWLAAVCLQFAAGLGVGVFSPACCLTCRPRLGLCSVARAAPTAGTPKTVAPMIPSLWSTPPVPPRACARPARRGGAGSARSACR